MRENLIDSELIDQANMRLNVTFIVIIYNIMKGNIVKRNIKLNCNIHLN